MKPLRAVTIANVNARDRMQCAWCRQTFGPAYVRWRGRFELMDRWSDPPVSAQHVKAVTHAQKRHPERIAA